MVVRLVERLADIVAGLVLRVWEGLTVGMAHSCKDFDDLLRDKHELVLGLNAGPSGRMGSTKANVTGPLT